MWEDWIRLKKELVTLGEELPPAELLPARPKKQSPDPTKRDASKEGVLAGGNMLGFVVMSTGTLESFDKNNPEMGIDNVARQMHQKTLQHYWVNIVKQQITGGGRPTLRDQIIQSMEAALSQTTFLTQAQALLGKAISKHTIKQNAEVN